MNYKTIIMCAVIGASMQSAWGMNEELAQETAQREIDMIHGGWLLNTTPKDDAFNASEFRKADAIIEQLDLLESGEVVGSGSGAYLTAVTECGKEHSNFARLPEFKKAATKILELQEKTGELSDMNVQELKAYDRLAGEIARELKTALATYRANNNNNKQE